MFKVLAARLGAKLQPAPYAESDVAAHFGCDYDKVKFKVKGQGTGHRSEITSAGVPKWSQVTASLCEKLTEP